MVTLGYRVSGQIEDGMGGREMQLKKDGSRHAVKCAVILGLVGCLFVFAGVDPPSNQEQPIIDIDEGITVTGSTGPSQIVVNVGPLASGGTVTSGDGNGGGGGTGGTGTGTGTGDEDCFLCEITTPCKDGTTISCGSKLGGCSYVRDECKWFYPHGGEAYLKHTVGSVTCTNQGEDTKASCNAYRCKPEDAL